MHRFVDLHLKPAALERYELPDIPYPLPVVEMQDALAGTGELPLAVMLYGLQRRSEEGGADLEGARTCDGSPGWTAGAR